jgi:NAD(P)-dependent dehydrogenase (short-subunit alcohol dehydrogenase family)
MVDVRDLMRLDGRVAIVTGGARGISRETAETLAAAGARVVLADLDKETAEGAAAKIRALGGERGQRRTPFRCGRPRGHRRLRLRGDADSKRIDADRLGDVL